MANSGTSTIKNKRMLRRRRARQKQIIKLVLLGIAIVAIIVLVIFLIRGKKSTPVYVDDLEITDISKDEAKEALMQKYPWDVRIVFQGEEYVVPNYMEEKIDEVLKQAYSEGAEANYEIVLEDTEEKVQEVVDAVNEKWSLYASNSEIISFNEETNEFVISESTEGYVIDSDYLREELNKCFSENAYVAEIEVNAFAQKPAITKENIQMISTYTSYTTNNAARNTNVRLSCEAVNGLIIQPGEKFSYNDTLGQRTAEKGYQMAGAYANGEHVTELGGGVCQLSSTLYNAAVDGGLKIEERVGHTYEPSYVTPGQDATVSFGYPDFVFTNNSDFPIGIKVTFEDRTVVVEIYGVPILEEGVKKYMQSEKVADLPAPEANYVLDTNLQQGEIVVTSAEELGSKWETYIILEKDGEIISEEYFHTTRYKGNPATIHYNLCEDGSIPVLNIITDEPNTDASNEEVTQTTDNQTDAITE